MKIESEAWGTGAGCNGLRSVLQLADDDSTSETQLEEEQEKRENGQRVALALACSDGDAKQKKDKCTEVVDGGVDRVVGQVTLRGSCGARWSGAGRRRPGPRGRAPSRGRFGMRFCVWVGVRPRVAEASAGS